MKIAYIGGGSAYAPGILRAFINLGDVYEGAEIALMDIDESNLDVVRQLGEKLARAAGADFRISATTDRRDAVRQADFVITSFRVGGFEARALDELIPLKYGVIGQETVGPGGFFFALRNLRVVRALCAEMEELCPNAWLVNYANPTNIIGEAVNRYTRVKALALCDGGKHDAYTVAAAMGHGPDEVEFRGLGLNHATWSTRFTIGGEDGVEMMLREQGRVLGDPAVPGKVKRMFRLAAMYGRLPNEYLQYYYFPEETVAEAKAAPLSRAQVIMSELPGIFKHYREQAESDNPRLTKSRGGTGFGEFAVDVITAVVTGSGRVEMVNVPNEGTLPALPPRRVAEVPCRLDRSGATPLNEGGLPGEVLGLIEALGEYQSLAAEVGWNGGIQGKEAAVRALASNPLMWRLDVDRIAAMYEEMVRAHSAWLR